MESRSWSGPAHRSRELAAVAAGRQPVLVIGEVGAGKLHTARLIHAAGAADAALTVVDATLSIVDGVRAIMRELADAFAGPDGTVILRHADALDDAGRRTAAALDARATGDVRFVATVDASFDDPPWKSLFPLHVTVPPLRTRTEELSEIIHALIAQNGGTGRMQPAAIETLARHDWSGNVRELEGVVRAALERRRSSDLTLNDLPVQYRTTQAQRRLSRMEQLERAAIVQALAESEGNRTKAAEALEIGRATLYRKIHAYGLGTR